jgi:ribosomal protein S18 acetylase RimI-like enzyme
LNVQIVKLKESTLEKHLGELVDMDKKAFDDLSWQEANFRLPLSNKFELSRIALYDKTPVGFLVASKYDRGKAHVHRIATLPRFRRMDVGSAMLNSLERACMKMAIAEITLESFVEREEVTRFYEDRGYHKMRGPRLVHYLNQKQKSDFSNRYLGIATGGSILVFHKLLPRKPARRVQKRKTPPREA